MLCIKGIFFFLFFIKYFFFRYGYSFLENTYFYHLWRKDIKHSFSIYFYYLYLNSTEINSNYFSKIIGILEFIPQFIMIIMISYKYYNDITFCLFLQTFSFVTFNKVCTVQV